MGLRSALKLLLIIIIVQFNTKAFSDGLSYLEPYPADILNPLPPLQFPTQEFVGEVSGLKQNLLDVEQQIKAMKAAKAAMSVISGGLAKIPEAGAVLRPTVDKFAAHLLSISNLGDLKIDMKIEMGIKKAFAKHSISNFNADVSVLKRHLRVLLDQKATNETKREHVIPPMDVCEKILRLFADETSVFWDLKLIFFPYLISFANLHAVTATAAGNVRPAYLPVLLEDMELLQTTVLKYYVPVRAERLSKLTIPQRQIGKDIPKFSVSSKAHLCFDHWTDVILNCPEMKITKDKSPQPPVRSCARGHSGTYARVDIRERPHKDYWGRIWKLDSTCLYVGKSQLLPEWFKDTVTGQIFCGWEDCWKSLHEHYGNQTDDLTMSALKLLPYITPPKQLPQPKNKQLKCERDSYGRLGYLVDENTLRPAFLRSLLDKSIWDTFGCHKGFCWTRCFWGWCYTKNGSTKFVKCKKAEDCCPEWKCGGACSA